MPKGRLAYGRQLALAKLRALGAGGLVLLAVVACAPWGTYRYVEYIKYPLPFILATLLVAAIIARFIMRRRIEINAPTLALVLLVAVVAASRFWTLNPAAWPTQIGWWAICVVCFWGVLIYFKSKEQLRALAYAAGIGCLFTITQISSDAYAYSAISGLAVVGENVNLTSYMIAACAYVLISYLTFFETSIFEKTLLSLFLLVAGAEIYVLGSRGALLSVVLALSAAAISPRVKTNVKIIAIGCMVAATVLITSNIFGHLLGELDVFGPKSTGNLSGRVILWTESLKQIYESPIFGIGPGSFPIVSSLRIEVHNLFLSIIVSVGIVGFSALAIFFGVTCREILQDRERGTNVLTVFLAFYLPIVTTGQTDTIVIIWITIAYTVSVAQAIREGEAPRHPSTIPTASSHLPRAASRS